jgi:hypothetical protein
MRKWDMENKYAWTLKGTFYECCRALDGQCGLQFDRELPHTCACLTTYQIKEGKINNLDMKGINIFLHMDEIGPKPGSCQEGAVYFSDNASVQQRNILEPFFMQNMEGRILPKCLGIKYVNIQISEEKGAHHIITPFGEQYLCLTVGGDGKNPIRIENGGLPFLSNVRICNTRFWKYHDYGKNMEYRNTSGQIADFTLQGH